MTMKKMRRQKFLCLKLKLRTISGNENYKYEISLYMAHGTGVFFLKKFCVGSYVHPIYCLGCVNIVNGD